MSADAIEPRVLPLASFMIASTLTVGDDCVVAVFVRTKVTS